MPAAKGPETTAAKPIGSIPTEKTVVDDTWTVHRSATAAAAATASRTTGSPTPRPVVTSAAPTPTASADMTVT